MHSARKNKIQFYLSRMRQRGFEAAAVLAGTGLTEARVVTVSFQATPDAYRRIILNMLTLTGDKNLGIAMGREFKISDLGVLGYAALSSATLAQAREVIQRYHVLNEYILVPSNYLYNGCWYLHLRESFPLGSLLPFAVEEFISRSVTLSTSLTNKPFPILEIHVTYGDCESSEQCARTFGCPIHYNQPKNLVKFDIERLNDPITLADDDVFAICDAQCRELILEQARQDLLSDKIRRILLNMPGRFPSMEEMADQLCVSARTLRRQLNSEAVTYQQILDSTRESLALQYLEHTSLTPKEIGFLLGYTNVSNFRRAFKTWTGKKLSDFRS